MSKSEKVIAQTPSSGSIVQLESSKVILYTEETAEGEENLVEVPNLINMSAQDANYALVSRGFNVKYDGNINQAGASIVEQSVQPGEMMPYGSVITITVRYFDGTA